MEYFSNHINFNLLKNHILKDPLIDWFNIQEYHNNHIFERDGSTYYREYILKESKKYKEKLLQQIIDRSQLDIPIYTCYKETLFKIKNNEPLILQGKLYNEDKKLYTKCDIIIRYDYFTKIFPRIDNIPFHLFCKEDGYLLINICYSSLHFRIDLKTIANDGLSLYKKCNLYSFREAMYKVVGERYPCFLLGKEYYYRKTHLPKDKFIGKIDFDHTIIDAYNKAYKWILYLKKNYQEMKILPKPSHKELYPNMNYKDSDWENEKMKLANEIKEITLIWNISFDERHEFLNRGITCWDDPKLLLYLKETKKKDIQERMIHMNKQNDILIYPRKNISNKLSTTIQDTNGIYFDIESFLSFDEKQNLFSHEKIQEQPVIGIIGFIYKEKYYDFTIEDFTNRSEKKNIEYFIKKLKMITKKDQSLSIYHWGHAEYNYIKYIQNKYPEIEFPPYQLIDVLDYFRTEPIIVQGVFKFGLKSIGSALYRNKLIKTTWGENDNGLDSMIKFKEICQNHKKKIPLKRYIDIKEIINYNRIDCQVLYEIVELLRDKYTHS